MYEIKVSPKIKECLKLAGLLERKRWIPFNLLKKAIKINSTKIEIPIHYQNIWFCLHQQTIRKITTKGYKTIKVLFPPVRVESNKIINLIRKSVKKVGLENFAKFCGRSKWSIYKWLSKRFVPLIVLMKACQILNKNLWQVLDGCKLCGNFHSIVFKNKLNSKQMQDLKDIIDWINTEGSISINGWSISISQHIEAKQNLKELRKKFLSVFSLEKYAIRIYDYKNMSILQISSSALRQILVLKYGIPLGDKSEVVKIFELDWRTIANYLITEGCFYLNGRGTGLAIGIASKSDDVRTKIKEFLKENGFHPSKSEGKMGKQILIQRKEESLKLLYKLWPYLNLSKKIQACKVLQNPKVFLSLRVDLKIVFPLIREFVNSYGKDKFMKLINKECSKYNLKKYSKRSIEHWIYPGSERNIPLFLVKKLCKFMKEDISKFIDPEILKIFNIAESFLQNQKVIT